MPHDHDQGLPQSRNLTTAFRWGVGLNLAYVVLEFVAGLWSNSLALLADAGHNLTDVAGLLIAWGAAWAATHPPTGNFTYGFGRATIMAATVNAMAILAGSGVVIWEAAQRFANPVDVPAISVMIVASVGIAVNFGTAFLFRGSRSHDLNAEGAYLHMAADAAVSAGVVLSAALILTTGWWWLDPAAAIAVSMLIGWTSFGLLRKTANLSMDGVPAGIERSTIETWLKNQPGVSDVHDVHIWALSTMDVAMTAHLVMQQGYAGDKFLSCVAEEMQEHFDIGHVTLQIETGDGPACPALRLHGKVLSTPHP